MRFDALVAKPFQVDFVACDKFDLGEAKTAARLARSDGTEGMKGKMRA